MVDLKFILESNVQETIERDVQETRERLAFSSFEVSCAIFTGREENWVIKPVRIKCEQYPEGIMANNQFLTKEGMVVRILHRSKYGVFFLYGTGNGTVKSSKMNLDAFMKKYL